VESGASQESDSQIVRNRVSFCHQELMTASPLWALDLHLIVFWLTRVCERLWILLV